MSKMIFREPTRSLILAALHAFYVRIGRPGEPRFSDAQTTSVMLSDVIGVMAA